MKILYALNSSKTFISKIFHCIKSLLSVSSKIYVFFYLAAIPLFAAVYAYLLPGQFYQSTAGQEVSVIEDSWSIRAGLSRAIVRMYKKNVLKVPPDKEEWSLDSEEIVVTRLNVISKGKGPLPFSDDRIRFVVGTALKNKRTGKSTLLDMVWELKLAELTGFVQKTEDGDFVYKTFTVQGLESWTSNIESINLSFMLGDHPNAKNEYTLEIPRQLEKKILEFVRAMEGFPVRLEHNYWRMLYFSVATITTLGLGDIVPVTMRARMAVASEAVVAVVLIGLFLSALANGIKERKVTMK